MKAFEVYQYLEGETATERDLLEMHSKFWNKGKWDNFVAPFLPEDPKGMTLVDMGCNAGLFLKLAEEKGFDHVIGVDANEEAVRRGLAWRDKNGGKYKIICSSMEKCIDDLPMADFTVFANVHYYFTINDWLDYLDKLQTKTGYCIVVTGYKKHKNVCWASADISDIRSYFKNWDEVGFIDELPTDGDPSPRRLWALCFKSRFIDKIPTNSLVTRNPNLDGFYEELDKGIPYKNTQYYNHVKSYRKKWSEGRLNRWTEERIRVFEDVKKNGLLKPIIIHSDSVILDGNHRYGVIKYLGEKDIFVRRVGSNTTETKIKLNLGCGQHKLAGFDNLDKITGWFFQNGLTQYANGSVDAITISHALMFLELSEVKKFMKEIQRVLKVGGVIRITEDDTENPLSDTYQTGWKQNYPKEWGRDASCLTGPKMMREMLESVQFGVYDVDENTTHFQDKTLMQSYHRGKPRCFFIEGVKR